MTQTVHSPHPWHYESSVEKGYVQQAMKQAEAAIESATARPA